MAKEAGWTREQPVARRDDWQDIVYVVNAKNHWRHVNGHGAWNRDGFNIAYSNLVPIGPRGGKPKAADYCENVISTVDAMAYLPGEHRIFEVNGTTFFNTYNPPEEPDIEVWRQDLADRFLAHLKLLCNGSEEHTATLLYWLAFLVQNPGKRIRWAPLIQGGFGIGKTTIGNVMREVLGFGNVSIVNPSTVNERFTGWASESQLTVFEELRASGTSRYALFERVKVYITDNFVSKESKGLDPVTVPNPTSYMAFTNHTDALPLSEDDRRWFVLFCDASRKELPDDYFDKLYQCVEEAGHIRKWLLAVVIPDDFNINDAPMTEYKKSVAAAEDSQRAGMTDLQAMIDDGMTDGVTTVAVRMDRVREALEMEGLEISRLRSHTSSEGITSNEEIRECEN
jgi:hypothetical protein